MKTDNQKKNIIAACELIALFLFFIIVAKSASAAEINLTLSHKSVDDKVSIDIVNDSLVKVDIKSVDIELNQHKHEFMNTFSILPGQKQSISFKVPLPYAKGSYPLIVTVRYANNGKILSLKHVGLFYFQDPGILASSCIAEKTSMREEGE